jgi:hypothetical protein
MGAAEARNSVRRLVRFIVIFVALLAYLAPAASALSTRQVGNGVAAIAPADHAILGPHASVLAVQGRERGPNYDHSATGSSVAAEGGSPWFEVTNATANRAGTFVPTTFDLSVGGEDFSVVANATKHIAEYATSTGAGSMPLSSLAGAVETAVDNGLLGPGRNFITVDNWELGIDTTDHVIYHAIYRL